MVCQWWLSFLVAQVPSQPETASTGTPATETPVETEVSEHDGSVSPRPSSPSGTPQKAMVDGKSELLCYDGYVPAGDSGDVARLKMSHQSSLFR